MNILFGGIEAGGTKFCCAVGDKLGNIQDKIVIPTTIPEETMPKVISFFREINNKTTLSALGIASFGPIDLNKNSSTYGYITTPPKFGWGHYDIVNAIKRVFPVPIGFDTDVNGAALGEHRFGAAVGLDTFLYVTIGTGIGAGGMVSGNLIHGLVHPEMGHIFIPHDRTCDPFIGSCPFHGDCLEGLASGPALQKRWGIKSAFDLPIDHSGWDLEANYLAYAFANYTMLLSPQKIIAGGGVMNNPELLHKIRPRVQNLLNGYVKHKKILKEIDHYIVAPKLGDNAGICGAIALAEKAYARKY